MVWPILSGTPALSTVTSAHGVTPGGLIHVAIFTIGAGLTGVSLGNFVPMVPTV